MDQRMRTMLCLVQRGQGKMATVTEIIVGLPLDIEQARRSLFSGNLNALEHWHARLENSLQVLTVLMQRIEEDLGQNEIFHSLCILDEEAFVIYSEINALLFGTSRLTLFSREGNGSYTQQPSAGESMQGRPRLNVTKENIMREYDVFRSWKVVARRLGVSVKTLRRRRVEFGMELSDVIGPRNTFSTISFQELCDTIKTVLDTLPDAGETFIIGSLRSRGIFVQRRRVREAIAEVDPINRALRRTFAVIRRAYNVPCPNMLW